MSDTGDNNPNGAVDDIESAICEVASGQGTSPQALLARVDRHLDQKMAEVRQQCLMPDDLVDYQTHGRLRPDLERHRTQCAQCAA